MRFDYIFPFIRNNSADAISFTYSKKLNQKLNQKQNSEFTNKKKLAQMKTKQNKIQPQWQNYNNKNNYTEIFPYSLHHFVCNYNLHCLTIR